MAKKKLPQKLQEWVEARKRETRCRHVEDDEIREGGMIFAVVNFPLPR
jgi:hypothetical protein